MTSTSASPIGTDDSGGRRQLSDEAADHVRELIMSGQLLPGSHIRQDQVAADLGISATPVREGLLALRGQGFVILKPRRGFVVAPLSATDIRDLFEAQALLAGEIVARAVDQATPDVIEEAERLQGLLADAAQANDTEEVERLNHQFHRALNLASDSPKLVWMLATSARFAPRRFFSSIAGWVDASVADHEEVLAALHDHDPEAGRRAMEEHIRKAGVLLAEHFEGILARGDE